MASTYLHYISVFSGCWKYSTGWRPPICVCKICHKKWSLARIAFRRDLRCVPSCFNNFLAGKECYGWAANHFLFMAALAAPYLHRWLSEWVIHHVAIQSGCAPIWSDNLQLPYTRKLEVIWNQTTSKVRQARVNKIDSLSYSCCCLAWGRQ